MKMEGFKNMYFNPITKLLDYGGNFSQSCNYCYHNRIRPEFYIWDISIVAASHGLI